MSRSSVVCVLLAAAALAFSGVASALVWTANLDNTLVPDENVFDAGACSPGHIVTHKFTLDNRSLRSITITSVTPSCSCDTEAKVAQSELARLEKTDITVRWQMSEKVGPAETRVVVGYLSGDGPGTVVLTMRGVVSSRGPVAAGLSAQHGVTQSDSIRSPK
jgi:hypothetical protein